MKLHMSSAQKRPHWRPNAYLDVKTSLKDQNEMTNAELAIVDTSGLVI